MSDSTIYIIDDDQQMVELLTEYADLLECNSNSYTKAEDFFDDIETFALHSIIILDLNMPGMDGIEVMRRLAKTNRKLPLVLVSGYDSGVLHSAEQLAKAYSLNIIATLSKPFNFYDFKTIIEQHTNTERRTFPRQDITFSALELKEGIIDKQLVLHYQPQINIQTNKLVSVEALVRWQHPQHGLIYPNLFIAVAENNGLIADVTAQVIQQAINQTLVWQSQNLNLQVSVNVSADNITSLSLPEQLSQMLKEHYLDPSILTLEITESSLMGKLITSLDILTRLRMKDIKLSIDDFGTGYSSLSQLYRMPFTELKVDQSFVENMTHDDDAQGIVKTCIMLGHQLNMQVVAEGVENRETLDLLGEMGCDIAQGYQVARPMPAGDIMSWIESRQISA